MLELNKVMLVGNLTRDPEVRVLAGGSSVASFGVAIGRRRRDSRTNEYVTETAFITVKAWNKQAEFMQQFFTKGKGIYVEGRLQQENWEKDGQKLSRLVVVAERLAFAETRAEEEARRGGAPAGAAGAGSGAGAGASSAPMSSEDPTAFDQPELHREPPIMSADNGPGVSSTDDDLPF
ncbi:MAG: single-stranded DNA-binding protein [Candidatus Sumerlaeota bacterium]|nr:single-stranded DNA-binding protein [Candidatus Sumerlaeota bacterium]